jgi:uncharacterized membrane protein YgcG
MVLSTGEDSSNSQSIPELARTSLHKELIRTTAPFMRSNRLSASLTEFKPFEAIVLVVTFTLGLISMMKTAVMLFFFAQRGGRGGKRGWMKHMGIRGGGKHGPGHKRGMGRGGRGGRKTGSGSSGGSGSEDEGANLLVVVDGKYRDEKA